MYCNGYEFLTPDRFTIPLNIRQSLESTDVVLIRSSSEFHLLEYALEALLTAEERTMIWDGSNQNYGIERSAKESMRENGVLQLYTETAFLTVDLENSLPLLR